jgi:hypothetical protein
LSFIDTSKQFRESVTSSLPQNDVEDVEKSRKRERDENVLGSRFIENAKRECHFQTPLTSLRSGPFEAVPLKHSKLGRKDQKEWKNGILINPVFILLFKTFIQVFN